MNKNGLRISWLREEAQKGFSAADSRMPLGRGGAAAFRPHAYPFLAWRDHSGPAARRHLEKGKS